MPSPPVGPPDVLHGDPAPTLVRSVVAFEGWLGELNDAVAALARVVRAGHPAALSGDQAAALVTAFGAAERTASAGVALFAPVVLHSGVYAKTGHASASEWLGALSGSSAAAAKARLGAAQKAAHDPALTEALHQGELSAPQLAVMTAAQAEAPDSTGDLLELIQSGASHRQLCDVAERLRAAGRSRDDEHARRAKVIAGRHLRIHQDQGGGIRGSFLCDEVTWARVAPVLEAQAKDRWRAAGCSASLGHSLEAHRLDALVELLGRCAPGSPDAESRHGARVTTVVLIDAAALRRGSTQGDELCEIEGIGPVSVAAATELLGQGGLRYVVKEGLDIATVTKTTRVVTACIDIALLVRDRTCVVPGCAQRLGLERDHCTVDFGHKGPTALANLARLCRAHHAQKTHGGYRLEGGPGTWKWIAPAQPKTAGYISRARRLAAAKAKAKAAAATTTTATASAKRSRTKAGSVHDERNDPRRT